MQLRPYQQEAVDAVYDHLRHKDTNPCVVLPTGSGKSLVLGRIASDAVSLWNGRVLVLAHVKELLEQNASKTQALCPGMPVGVYSAGLGRRDTSQPVVVAGIQSVYDKADLLGRFDLAIIDECHLIPEDGDGMYRTFLEAERRLNPIVRVVGLTATPYRLKGGLICKPGNILNEVCYEVGVRELIDAGYLSRLSSKAGRSGADLANLHIRGGEFVHEEVEAAVNGREVVDAACREIAKLARDRRSILIFCASVAHCRHVAERIRYYTGDECAVLTGETPADERADLVRRFRGEGGKPDLFGERKPPLRFLANMGVLTTGFDAPNTDCVVLLRPTNSAGLYVQMVGRGFRLSPETGKRDCLVLDYGGNIQRHGPVDAVHVHDRRPGEKTGPLVRVCPECQEILPIQLRACPACGYEFPREEKPPHETSAARAGILSGETFDKEKPVVDVSYAVHHRRDNPDAPPTVRVTYHFDLLHSVSEWLCPEHTGYARGKFRSWWLEHAPGCEIPSTAADAVWLAEEGAVLAPTHVTVRTVAGERYPRVVGYKLPPHDEPASEHEEIPF